MVYIEGGALFIDRTEVTVEDYSACVEAGACAALAPDDICRAWAANPELFGAPEHPVSCVSWFDARAYCRWRGKRLPTELEWEKAARGPEQHRYPWGNTSPSCQRTIMLEQGLGCGTGAPWDVASMSADLSSYGVYDMAGNVREWTATPWRSSRTGEVIGAVVRGSGFGSPATEAGVMASNTTNAFFADDDIGFRCACTASDDLTSCIDEQEAHTEATEAALGRVDLSAAPEPAAQRPASTMDVSPAPLAPSGFDVELDGCRKASAVPPFAAWRCDLMLASRSDDDAWLVFSTRWDAATSALLEDVDRVTLRAHGGLPFVTLSTPRGRLVAIPVIAGQTRTLEGFRLETSGEARSVPFDFVSEVELSNGQSLSSLTAPGGALEIPATLPEKSDSVADLILDAPVRVELTSLGHQLVPLPTL